MAKGGVLPLVGIPCDVREIAPHPFHAVGEKYIDALAHGAAVMPLLLPSFGAGRDLAPLEGRYGADDLLERLDGVFLPGSPSNVEPRHYGGPAPRPDTLLDRQRDSLALPLVRRAVARGVPLLAVCRGIQEMNAALGGTLFQHVCEVAGRMDHRPNAGKGAPRELLYGPAHEVETVAGGLLRRLTGLERYTVNSVHGQGIDRLAAALRVEARAGDGQIEAVAVEGAAFQLGVQWHPEWRFRERACDHALFAAFGEACRAHAAGAGLKAA